MIEISAEAPEKSIVDFVKRWMKLLADNRLDDACALLKEERHLEVIELSDENGYAFDYDIPLNGEWSDLTAQFEFLKRTNAFAVVLHDFHVL